MKDQKNICIVVTARASYCRAKTIIQAIKDHRFLNLQLVLSGSSILQRYGSILDQINDDGFQVTKVLQNIIEGDSLSGMVKSTGLGLLELASTFESLKPDIVITVADRHETIATAIAASYMNIPLAHVQGGEISGSIDNKVRHAISQLADIHFVSSSSAAEVVRNFGKEKSSIHITGCPSIDIAREISKQPSSKLKSLLSSEFKDTPLDGAEKYIIVLQHPDTTVYGTSMAEIYPTLEAIQEIKAPTVWFTPNVDAGSLLFSDLIGEFRNREEFKHVTFRTHLKEHDFLLLVNGASCLVGNSSVGIREASFLGVPVVNVGNRQKNRMRSSNVIDVGCEKSDIISAVNFQMGHRRYPQSTVYGHGGSGVQIAEILSTFALPATNNETVELLNVSKY